MGRLTSACDSDSLSAAGVQNALHCHGHQVPGVLLWPRPRVVACLDARLAMARSVPPCEAWIRLHKCGLSFDS